MGTRRRRCISWQSISPSSFATAHPTVRARVSDRDKHAPLSSMPLRIWVYWFSVLASACFISLFCFTDEIEITAVMDKTKGKDDVEKNIGPYTSQQVIIMGLPKTGTTSLANAFQALGYNVSHGMGDTLVTSSGRCNVIVECMVHQYKELDKNHPNATWVISYSKNVTQWVDSG
mmetsp:Transcript_18410/g.39565  ORF Transcript_18410/g.39565 Transcript_18410/m.39565 type:complete len:174 (+) Transcript_18410:65-586(+)